MATALSSAKQYEEFSNCFKEAPTFSEIIATVQRVETRMSYSLEEKVKLFAIFSRLGVILLQFFTNLIIPDHSAEAFKKPLHVDNEKHYLDGTIKSGLGGLTNWDAQYFLHIAEYGYTYENTLAFFPLFPIIIRQLSYFVLFIINHILYIFLTIGDIISMHSTLIVASVLFNNFVFVKTSVILYKLSLLVLKNEKLAYITAILFCINPATIFFSACYSESLYCFLTFYGMLKIEEKNSLVNFVVMGMTGAVRSNGIINLGFLVYKYIKVRFTGKKPFFYSLIFNFGIILSILPFLTYQLYCYAKFCLPNVPILPDFILAHGKSNNFVLPGSNSTWCTQTIPIAYSYVQKHYWNVGFLKYYEIKQIPNFALAAPMIYIVLQGTWTFARHYCKLVFQSGKLVNEESGNELPISAFPYVVQALFLAIFAIFMIHIQVATRLLASSSPAPYWYCAKVIALSLKDSIESNVLKKLSKKSGFFYESLNNKKSKWKTFIFSETFRGYAFFIKWYFIIYFFVGTLMFSNNLPWT